MNILQPPKQLNLLTGNLVENWTSWEQQFRVYFQACELSEKSKSTQVAVLLHTAGPEAQKVHETFQYAKGESKNDYECVLNKFKSYVEPRRNIVFERHKFWCVTHKEGLESFIAELRKQAAKCDFAEPENMLRDKLVFAHRSDAVRERLLREKELNLQKALDICRAAEASHQQARQMGQMAPTAKEPAEAAAARVDQVRTQSYPGKKKQHIKKKECKFCGKTHGHKCPAYGKKCMKCGMYNHFANVCFSRQQKKVSTLQCSDSYTDSYDNNNEQLFIGTLKTNKRNKSDSWYTNLKINGKSLTFNLDTGADTNVMPLTMYNSLNSDSTLQDSPVTLVSFDNSRIKPVGQVCLKAECAENGKNVKLNFHVTDHSDTAVLGKKACAELNLVQRINVSNIKTKTVVSDKTALLKEYVDVFQGLGEYDKEYDIQLKKDAVPIIQPMRKFPFSKLKPLKETLDNLKTSGIVKDVDKPTDWVNNLVVTEKKDGSLRVCLDPKPLNTAIQRELYQIPTPAEVQAKLSGKKIFSVIDMKDGYWHVKLSDPASHLCTFHTPWGRMRFTRMPFGISSASEIMQKRNEETFADIEGVHIVADDIIIAACDELQHDARMMQVMQRAREKNVRFNRNKIQYKVNSVNYMGNVVTENGLTPDPAKISAIMNMPKPNDRQSLQRLLGMIKYLAQYVPHESDHTAPLRELLKKNVPWCWAEKHDQALQKVRQALTNTPMLQYYDVSQPVVLQCDASQRGLGACLMQATGPIAYASRAMTTTECNYSQLEKEMLAICFACSKFHQYIYGKEVTVNTDHKPLETIVKKPIANAPPRLQRMMLQLQRYVLTVYYVPGRLMYTADTLSRAYEQGKPGEGCPEDMDVMIYSLASELDSELGAKSIQDIKSATEKDECLNMLKNFVKTGFPEKPNKIPNIIKPYWNIRDELHELDGVLCAGNRIIVPRSMRKEMLHLIHESHLGQEKNKKRAREVIFWPNMNREIEETVSQCDICQKYRDQQTKQPLIPHTIPNTPWYKLGMDIMTVRGEDYLVVVDYYSKYPEIAKLENKTASNVILHLKSILARHGIAAEIVSDNMPFASREFVNFANKWGICLTTSSPLYSRSNGQSEITVKTVKNLIKKALDDGKDAYLALLEYRTTPITGMDFSPAQMLMSRRLRTKLPTSEKLLKPKTVKPISQLRERQRLYKKYHDRGDKDLPDLQPGDNCRYRKNGLWIPAVVVRKTPYPRSYLIKSNGVILRRNRRHLLKVNSKNTAYKPPQYRQCDDLDDIQPDTADLSNDVDSTCSTRDDSTDAASCTDNDSNDEADSTQPAGTRTRSGREVRLPSRFNFFEM